MIMYDSEYILEIVLDDDLFPIEHEPTKNDTDNKGEINNERNQH